MNLTSTLAFDELNTCLGWQVCWQASGESNSFQTDTGVSAGTNTYTNCPATLARLNNMYEVAGIIDVPIA